MLRFRSDLETGGILIGHADAAGSISVTHASGPGPQAIHLPTYFLRDTGYCAEVLRRCYEASGADYVGEWHSHVGRLNRPSSGDLHTLRGIMNDPDYEFDSFAMVIAVRAGRVRRRRIRLHGYVATPHSVMKVKITGFVREVD